jgi:dinuclear metal center YbgI/SA1388 family protein
VKVADLVGAMEAIAPARFAASWDNVGLLVGDPAAPLRCVLLAIDCTADVVAEAVAMRADAVVAYHPPIFEPRRRFVAGMAAFDLARRGVAVYSPHTALDAAEGGTNDVLADALGMTGRAPLQPLVFPEAGAIGAAGFGRVGGVERAPLAAIVARVKRALGLAHVLVAGPLDRVVGRAAVCAGSGGELLGPAIDQGAEVFVTGELRHHDVLRALGAGVAVVCTLHSASERCALVTLEERLASRLPGVTVRRSAADREPIAVG